MNIQLNLNRFIEAQNNVYENVLEELINGNKVGHWMWFIFPQISGLGQSSISQYYSIKSEKEAIGYFKHPILGKRIVECTNIVLNVKNRSANDIFGSIDRLKFRSSMTLFNIIQNNNNIFNKALIKYYNGENDSLTLNIMNQLRLKRGNN
jgi:uncharacterized protein (DUF1810 family)